MPSVSLSVLSQRLGEENLAVLVTRNLLPQPTGTENGENVFDVHETKCRLDLVKKILESEANQTALSAAREALEAAEKKARASGKSDDINAFSKCKRELRELENEQSQEEESLPTLAELLAEKKKLEAEKVLLMKEAAARSRIGGQSCKPGNDAQVFRVGQIRSRLGEIAAAIAKLEKEE